MGQSNIKGDIAELAVAKRFLELNYWVSKPFGDDAPYDLIVDLNGSLKRVQVKYVTPINDTLPIRMLSSTGVIYNNTVEIIAVYNPMNGKVYTINAGDFNNSNLLSLRLIKTKNNQKIGVHLAENYEL